jgi:transposase
MHPKVEGRARRVHDADIKSKVLAECRRPGASVSAVALAHGLNANLVRKWMQGRGLQRAGLKAEDEPTSVARAAPPMPAEALTGLQFVPVGVSVPDKSIDSAATTPWRPGVSAVPADAAAIEVELRRGGSHVAVRWPAAQAAQCAVWLRELVAVLK